MVSQSEREPMITPTRGASTGSGGQSLGRHLFDNDHVLRHRKTVEIENELADTKEAAAVMACNAVRREAGDVGAGGVADVSLPCVGRMAESQPAHQMIA